MQKISVRRYRIPVLEAHAEALPEVSFEGGPAADGIVVDAAGVGVEEGGSAVGRGLGFVIRCSGNSGSSGFSGGGGGVWRELGFEGGEAGEGRLLKGEDFAEQLALGALPQELCGFSDFLPTFPLFL